MFKILNVKWRKDLHAKIATRGRRVAAIAGVAGLVAGLAVVADAFLPGLAAAAAKDGITVLASDASGVTLQFTLPAYQVTSVSLPEGAFAHLVVPGLTSTVAVEGRPLLPADATMLGLPPNTIASVRVVQQTTKDLPELSGREIEPVGKSDFRPDGKSLSPVRTFYRDIAYYQAREAWPAATAELGPTGTWRHQNVATVRIQPFRVNPFTRQVTAVTSAVVRVDFVPVGTAGARAGASTAGAAGGSLVRDDGFEDSYRHALLNYDAARLFRIAPPVPTRLGARFAPAAAGTAGGTVSAAASYDPTDEWTLRVDTTGVWRVTYAQLAAQGFPSGTPVAQLALTRREYAGGQVPPFNRVPVAVRVVEDPAGVAGTFDAGDALEFYGQSWRERATPTDFRGRFGDADVFYLGIDPASGGARIPSVSADLGLASPTRPASFPSRRLYERRFYYNVVPIDTCHIIMSWTDPTADQTFTDTLTTWTPDVDPAGTVRFEGRFNGVLQNPFTHTIWMRWKRPSDNLLTSLVTATFFAKDPYNSDTTFAASLIDNGTNKIDWRGYAPIAGDLDGIFSGGTMKSYTVTDSRFYRAFQNVLDLNSSDASGGVEIEVDQFAAQAAPNVTVYDVTDSSNVRALAVPANFVRATGSGVWAARFQDQVAAGTRRRYFAVLAAPRLPDANVARAGRAYATPIWDPPGQPDLIIVTPEAFRSEADRLAAHRRSQGFDVLVAPEKEVDDAFDGGRRSDWAIRRLFQYAYARWNARYALLVGDGNDDARNEMGTSDVNWMPVHDISGPVGAGGNNELSPSDFWYVDDLGGIADGDLPCTIKAPNFFADMSIGRLPVGSLAQMSGLVDKLISYDTSDPDAAWRKKFMLVSDDAYSYASFDGDPSPNYCFRPEEKVFEAISNNLESELRNEGGYSGLNLEQFRLRERLLPLNRVLPTPTDLAPCMPLSAASQAESYTEAYTGPQLRTELGDGALVFCYQGHGSAVVLAHEALWRSDFTVQDGDFVFNEGKPYVFMAFSCHVNNFASFIEGLKGDCLGENMVLGPQNPPRPSAGGLASFASTNFELLPSDYTGVNHLNNWIFRSMFVDPPSDALHGERGARVLLGEAISLGEVISASHATNLEARAIQTYTLLGDPTTSLQTGAPELSATANGQAVTSGGRYQPGAAGDSIAYVVDIADESRIDDLTLTITGEGARSVLPAEYVITPSFPDTANGGAGRQYQVVWTARPQAKDANLVVSCQDRAGLPSSFTLPLRLEAQLRVDGQPYNSGDVTPAAGSYQLLVNSPAELVAADFDFKVDGAVPAGLLVTPAATDSSRRLWALNWTGAYDTGSHDAVLALPGGAQRHVAFSTSKEPRVALQNVFAFPVPFAKPPLTFNFTLSADQAATVALKIYTVSGSLVYQRVEPGVGPGYHQWVWLGTDTYSDAIPNGTYLYQLIASDDRGLKSIERGKFARLR
jgi:hypothetical protein